MSNEATTTKSKNLTTPFGTAVFPRLNTPDTKFKPEGEYSVKIQMKREDAEPLRAQIDALLEEHYKVTAVKEKKPVAKLKKADTYPIVDVIDDAGNETGDVTIKASMKAEYKSRKDDTTVTQRPMLFQADLTPLPKGKIISGGSILRANVRPYLWYTAALGAGVSLQLVSVQVKTLVEYNGTGGTCGFDKVEGDVVEATDEVAEGETESAAAGAGVTSGADY